MESTYRQRYPLGLIAMVLGFLAILAITAAIVVGTNHASDNYRNSLNTCVTAGRTPLECRVALNGMQ